MRSFHLQCFLHCILHFRYDTTSHRYRGFGLFTKNSGEICRRIEKRRVNTSRFCLIFGDAHDGFLRIASEFSGIPVARQIFQKYKIIDGATNVALVSVIVQIVVFEILRNLNIVPDVIIGDCFYGKFAKAYAERLLTMEQTLTIICKHLLNKIDGESWEFWNDVKNVLSDQNGVIGTKIAAENSLPPPLNHCLDLQAYQCVQNIIKTPTIIKQNGDCLPANTEDFVTLQLGPTTETATSGDVFYLPQKEDSLITFLELIGKLHLGNITPNCAKLYPPIQFPVSRGTPSISPLIRWDHHDEWFVISYRNTGKLECYEKAIGVNVKETEWNYITGHVIDGN